MVGKLRHQEHFRLLFPLYYDKGKTTYAADFALSEARRTTWVFPYWHTYRTQVNKPAANGRSASSKDAVAPEPAEPSARDKHTSRHTVPLLFNRRSMTWVNPDDATPLIAADNTFYLFPYYRSTYHSANAESANNFFLLGGWGHSTQTKPTANKHYAYLLPFLFYKHQAEPAPPENPAEDWADTKLWILPYWRRRGHTGNQERRTDFLVPLYLRSYEAHTEDRTWWTVLAGVGETQAPAYLKRKSDPNDGAPSTGTATTPAPVFSSRSGAKAIPARPVPGISFRCSGTAIPSTTRAPQPRVTTTHSCSVAAIKPSPRRARKPPATATYWA